jgi:hypothetical protein
MLALRNAIWHAVLAVSLVLIGGAVVGCGSSESTSDAKIAKALDLKRAGGAYVIEDTFCTVGELLNDSDEVEQADGGGASFLIASPDGEIGILAQRPFAPKCTRKAENDLKRLAGRSG